MNYGKHVFLSLAMVVSFCPAIFGMESKQNRQQASKKLDIPQTLFESYPKNFAKTDNKNEVMAAITADSYNAMANFLLNTYKVTTITTSRDTVKHALDMLNKEKDPRPFLYQIKCRQAMVNTLNLAIEKYNAGLTYQKKHSLRTHVSRRH
jgi:hypothetical protein